MVRWVGSRTIMIAGRVHLDRGLQRKRCELFSRQFCLPVPSRASAGPMPQADAARDSIADLTADASPMAALLSSFPVHRSWPHPVSAPLVRSGVPEPVARSEDGQRKVAGDAVLARRGPCSGTTSAPRKVFHAASFVVDCSSYCCGSRNFTGSGPPLNYWC